ncbi:MAG TPA: HAD family phosphatase [Dehalococcoidia bacterium]|nr:HAD family phosphatase [Dehalococcoidia bacterium]
MTQTNIKALIFDFGGVVLDMGWHKMSEIETTYGMKPGSFRSALWGHETWRQREVGVGTLEDYQQAVQREIEAAAGRPVPEAIADWLAYKRVLNEDLLNLAARLRGDYKIGLLSNADERLEQRLQEDLKIFDRFDDVINSARVGLAKPDPRIYALACQRLEVQPEETVFVDDLQRNIDAAEAAGMYGIHFLGDNAALFTELHSLGIPVEDHELRAAPFYEMPAEWKAAMAASSNVSA